MVKLWPFLLLIALAPFLARAGGGEVVVVYNKNMPGSRDVADYYAKMRQVPRSQVYGFSMPTNEVISRIEFTDLLQLPLAGQLEASGLWQFGKKSLPGRNGHSRTVRTVIGSKIRYAVLCYGVPLKIAADSSIVEPQDPSIPLLFQENSASVDSELAWLPRIEEKPPLDGPMPNWVYCATNEDLLSPTNSILLVSRLDGPSAEIAMGLVKKSVQAEQDGLWGRAYFDARGITTNSGYKLGDEWILESARICGDFGYDTVVDDNPDTFPADFPMSQIAIYAGWYATDANGPFSLPKVEFMPGAFAYHLHSYSAETLRSTTLRWCGPLLAKGATCTMGCVDEPSIQFTPNVAAFLARWMGSRFTFGEAAWSAQPALSWQTTVIGDPLYRPFGKSPAELHAELSRSHNPLVEWSYLRAVNLARLRGVPLSGLEDFLENLTNTESSAVLTEKLAELCDIQGKPDAAIEFFQHALKLDPSPEQRIRIRLALGQDLIAQNNKSAAVQDYKQLLLESPDYPGKDKVSDKVSSLEQNISRAK